MLQLLCCNIFMTKISGVCISRPPVLCLAPGPGPQLVLTGPGLQYVFTCPGS